MVYHLRNYGISIWYDRFAMVMGDNRQEKNLDEGAGKCKYALAILSKNTASSICTMEELAIIKSRYANGEVTVFPILYELLPADIPSELQWIKKLIFKETDRRSGTREICNHIACKITGDYVERGIHQSVQDILNVGQMLIFPAIFAILSSYQSVDSANLNSRVALLYSTYLIMVQSNKVQPDAATHIAAMTFERLFAETRLYLAIDYRELWLLENCICILVDSYLVACKESNV